MIGLTTTLDSYKLCRLSSLFQKDNGTIPKQHLNPELSTFLAVGLLTQAAMSAFFPPFFFIRNRFFHTNYCNYSFPFTNASKTLSSSPPIQINSLNCVWSENRQASKE